MSKFVDSKLVVVFYSKRPVICFPYFVILLDTHTDFLLY